MDIAILLQRMETRRAMSGITGTILRIIKVGTIMVTIVTVLPPPHRLLILKPPSRAPKVHLLKRKYLGGQIKVQLLRLKREYLGGQMKVQLLWLKRRHLGGQMKVQLVLALKRRHLG